MLTIFQSTLPARGATPENPISNLRMYYFNPRSLHGERQNLLLTVYGATTNFNPRSLHGERPNRCKSSLSASVFQSTLPARGATRTVHYKRSSIQHFNPRSLHGERRYVRRDAKQALSHFNPRSLHGERR